MEQARNTNGCYMPTHSQFLDYQTLPEFLFLSDFVIIINMHITADTLPVSILSMKKKGFHFVSAFYILGTSQSAPEPKTSG